MAGDQGDSLVVLEARLSDAKAELEEYQRLLVELPDIYEGKFRQQLHALAQEIRQLLDERRALQQQVQQALSKVPPAEALPAAPIPMRRRPLREPRAFALAADWLARLPQLGTRLQGQLRQLRLATPTALKRWPPRQLLLASAVVVGGLTLLVAGVSGLRARRPAIKSHPAPLARPVAPVPKLPAQLTLQARGGPSWVVVQDLRGRKRLEVLLMPGATRQLPLGQGLRLRSGRPDRLYLAVDGAKPHPLGTLSHEVWRVIRP